MISLGTLFAFAFWIRSRRRVLDTGSGPPSRTAMEISFPILVKTLARCASVFSFLCIMFFHLECPDIVK